MFTRRLFPGEQRPGYEFLGVLLLLQIATQSYLSLTSTKSESNPTTTLVENVLSPPTEVKDVVELTTRKINPNETDSLLRGQPSTRSRRRDNPTIHTPGKSSMSTMLDPMKDPTAAECGHLFCWTCILRWTGESVGRGECPICRGQCGREGLLRLAGYNLNCHVHVTPLGTSWRLAVRKKKFPGVGVPHSPGVHLHGVIAQHRGRLEWTSAALITGSPFY